MKHALDCSIQHQDYVVFCTLFVHINKSSSTGIKTERNNVFVSQDVEYPDSFSSEMQSLLRGLLQRDVYRRLGCRDRG